MVKRVKKSRFRADKAPKEELVDPILYTAGLDEEKYPFLKPESKEEETQDIENPLNKR